MIIIKREHNLYHKLIKLKLKYFVEGKEDCKMFIYFFIIYIFMERMEIINKIFYLKKKITLKIALLIESLKNCL